MIITAGALAEYRNMLSRISAKAADEVQQYMMDHHFEIDETFMNFVDSIVAKYGEAAGSLSAQFYDNLAEYWQTQNTSQAFVNVVQKPLQIAEVAEIPTRDEVAKAVYGTMKESPNKIPDTVGRLVKRTAEDTTLKNAIRDGAQFAWVPSGDTCAFCIMLASRGWQYASKKALKNGHAEHIHPNCDCTYVVRFDTTSTVAGYDPKMYRRIYDEAEGATPKERINYIRRDLERRTTNQKPFEQLTELMTLKHVKSIVKEMEVDMRGAKIKINRNVEMLGKGLFGHTSDDGKYVALYPDAFQNREELVKTIGHESVHLMQIEKDGKVKSIEDLISREEEARASEKEWWEQYVKKTGYRSGQ